MSRVIYHEFNRATRRYVQREAEICGPVEANADGDKLIVPGVAEVAHPAAGGTHVKRKRAYQNLRVNFARAGQPKQWKPVDGVGQANDSFSAQKSYFEIVEDDTDAPTETAPRGAGVPPASVKPASKKSAVKPAAKPAATATAPNPESEPIVPSEPESIPAGMPVPPVK